MESYQYENIYIGAFIYSMGYIAGIEGIKNTVTLNLYQQTPKDKTLGDLFTNWGGKNFLVEFKRSKKHIKNELRKENKAIYIEYLNNEADRSIINKSRRGHFLSFPVFEELHFSIYMDANNSAIKSWNIEVLVRNLNYNNGNVGLSFNEFKDYLDVLNKYSNEKVDTSSVSGIIVNISENNEIRFVQFQNLNVLNQMLSEKSTIKKSISLKRKRKGRKL